MYATRTHNNGLFDGKQLCLALDLRVSGRHRVVAGNTVAHCKLTAGTSAPGGPVRGGALEGGEVCTLLLEDCSHLSHLTL